ncbi:MULTISPECIES: preprotein translocase subunit SecG [unclassified Mucilaginibacter]|uniref:preprotein translocase subunit SecG n=1 Tax=unclassified Mucilaginibacter TaxID=2617802 RepID=UPI0009627071|nr:MULTISPECIES: preprotein translocase subunit SecG [unclassified Mucilaginibacter]OJW15752.1 MAG: preprotein translocase subunit SecG [Mucilaginibacter sp. 44-25]PLW88291.1 MAG: preprotein translocase subunit SecG [Mucilaginibacter sp.]HEK19391.1 preprotein translocase subunit SecG [Bacteroidota bacterium]
MYLLLIIITIILCVLLGLIVLIQNPKGGGLASNFSGSSQLMGVQKTGDFLEKGTWALAIGIMVLSLVINVSVKGGAQKSDDGTSIEKLKQISKPSATPSTTPLSVPAAPATAPAQKTPSK